MATAASTLPSVLVELLDRLPDRDLAARLDKIYTAAAQAIARLSDIDLVKYETSPAGESQDLSLWEEMAPVIRDTVMGVNVVLSMIREQLPAGYAGGKGAGAQFENQAREVAAILREAMQRIAAQVTELGEGLRNPQVMSDRWRLLSEIQRFRTRFREEMGELVYGSALVLEDVHRKEVIPGYAEDVSAAVLVRAMVTDLARVVEVREEKIGEAEPEDIQWHAQQLEKELDLFGHTPAYQSLRAQDKQVVIEFRRRLDAAVTQPRLKREELKALVAPFVQFVQGLMQVNQREVLIAHDREVVAACGVRLEQAEHLLGRDPVAAARGLAEATLGAQALYGRAPALDTILRAARKTSLASLTGPALQEGIDRLRMMLAELLL